MQRTRFSICRIRRIADRRALKGPAVAIPALAKRLARPQFTHAAVKSAPVDKEINLTFDVIQ